MVRPDHPPRKSLLEDDIAVAAHAELKPISRYFDSGWVGWCFPGRRMLGLGVPDGTCLLLPWHPSHCCLMHQRPAPYPARAPLSPCDVRGPRL